MAVDLTGQSIRKYYSSQRPMVGTGLKNYNSILILCKKTDSQGLFIPNAYSTVFTNAEGRFYFSFTRTLLTLLLQPPLVLTLESWC